MLAAAAERSQLLPLLDVVPPVTLHADRGYDHDLYRKQVRARGVVSAIARRGTEHGSGLGVYRWVVERTFAWLHGVRRLFVRWNDERTSMKRSSNSPVA